MNIVIDSYNLLKQLFNGELISDQQRTWFIHKAISYARSKGHTLTIVFDAGPYYRQTKENYGPVSVIYSGHKNSADDVIMSIIAQRPHDLLLVTTDRVLNKAADRAGIPSIDSLDFYSFMKDSHAPAPTHTTTDVKKMRPEEHNDELDTLMHEASMSMIYKQEEEPVVHKKKRTSSRAEKALEKILEKL